MTYRLFYWALRGRGEQIRLLLNELGQDFADVHVDMDDQFMAMRNEGPGTLYGLGPLDGRAREPRA